MITYSGRRVFPESEEFPTLGDIGIGLGRKARFSGQTRDYYPVLAHCLTVASIMPESLGLYGLMHDCAESCLGDTPRPWKTDEVKATELVLQERIYRGHNLQWPIPDALQELVDHADNAALAAEAHVLGFPGAQELWPEPNSDVMLITERHLEMADKLIEAEIAMAVFEEAFDYYEGTLAEAKKELAANNM